MIVKSADPTKLNGASLTKMLNEIEALLVNGYTLNSIAECDAEIFAFLLNVSELKKKWQKKKDKMIDAYFRDNCTGNSTFKTIRTRDKQRCICPSVAKPDLRSAGIFLASK
jgi:hypothetical protein